MTRSAAFFAVVLLVSGLAAAALSADATPGPSPLAQIREGMDRAAVTQVAGQPTDSCTHITGKAFIPLYPGNDKEITALHYKGQGRVILSGGGVKPQVIRVEIDPAEDGRCRATD